MYKPIKALGTVAAFRMFRPKDLKGGLSFRISLFLF